MGTPEKQVSRLSSGGKWKGGNRDCGHGLVEDNEGAGEGVVGRPEAEEIDAGGEGGCGDEERGVGMDCTLPHAAAYGVKEGEGAGCGRLNPESLREELEVELRGGGGRRCFLHAVAVELQDLEASIPICHEGVVAGDEDVKRPRC